MQPKTVPSLLNAEEVKLKIMAKQKTEIFNPKEMFCWLTGYKEKPVVIRTEKRKQEDRVRHEKRKLKLKNNTPCTKLQKPQ